MVAIDLTEKMRATHEKISEVNFHFNNKKIYHPRQQNFIRKKIPIIQSVLRADSHGIHDGIAMYDNPF
jgi:hypothetical protein